MPTSRGSLDAVQKLAKSGIEQSTDLLVLRTYSQDLWPRMLLQLREGGPQEPVVDLVLWPETPQQVADAIAAIRAVDGILIPYGAGSGVCGATRPPDQESRLRVVVDAKRMNRVRSIDRVSMTVWAEAGIIGENLERRLNQEGLTLGHFPSSIYCSSLGGYLAARSAGQFSTKYGKIEDQVLSLEVVLPDGRLAETSRAPRSAMGPDWTQFLLGTEGTICFFTAARLQVQELPAERRFLSFAPKDVGQAVDFSRAVLQGGLRPAVLRIYDPLETSMALNSATLKEAGYESGAAMVALFEGRPGVTRAEAEEAVTIARALGVPALKPLLAQHWYDHRYDVSYKQQQILSHQRMLLDTFEVAATWDRIPEVYRAVKAAPVGMGMIMAHFSHFYHTGANIYFTLVSHAGFTGSSVDKYDQIWEGMLKAAFESGATLSHHHGVGAQKNAWMRKERGVWVELFEKVKRGFDPENRFNPSKMGL